MTSRKPPASRKPRQKKPAASAMPNDPLAWLASAPGTTDTDQTPPDNPAAPPAAAAQQRMTPMSDTTATQAKPQTPPTQELWANMRATQLFDQQANPIMIADSSHKICYVNEAAYAMFEAIEDDLRRDLPNFRAREILGKSVDVFHKDPVYQREMMKGLKSTHHAQFDVGNRALSFVANPILRDDDSLDSIMVEWRDNTNRLRAERENADVRAQFRTFVEQLGEMAAQHDAGEIDAVMDPDGFELEQLKDTANVLNQMIASHIAIKRKALRVFAAFADGNFDHPFEKLPGKRAFISDIIERNREKFKEITNEIRDLSDAIVNGNLDRDIDLEHFKGDFRGIMGSFERAYSSLNKAFGTISEQVEQVSQTVDQMTDSSQSLSEASQIASASVDEVSASAEETDAQVKANAEAAQNATKSVKNAAALTSEGNQKITDMVAAMDGIMTSSADIAKIIKVIDEIAFQTNLLALNAAVEAARAGQHGRGFAVVAQEVRNLAGRSAKAARETSDLIEGADNRVKSGVRIAKEANEAFVKIAAEIEQVKEIVEQIDVASEEQARGVAQISQAITEIAKTSLSTSQQADELAATSSQMNAAARQMNKEIRRFKLREPDTSAQALTEISQLSPELLAQIQQMIGRATPAAPKNGTGSSPDTDTRGYTPF